MKRALLITIALFCLGSATATSDWFMKKIINGGTHIHDTRESALIHAGGIGVAKTLTIDGSGAQLDNLYTVTGSVRILSISGCLSTVTDSTTFSSVKLDVYDGAVASDLTDAVNASGAVTGALLYKNSALANPLAFVNADQVRVSEAATNKAFYPAVVVAKSGATTYLRLSFTGDGATNIISEFTVVYEPLCSDSEILAL